MPHWSSPPRLRVTGPGESINTMWSWFAAAPPEGKDRHWKDTSSAKELARAWAGSGAVSPPAVMLAALGTRPELEDFQTWDVIAEARTLLDGFGRPRQHDLIAIGAAQEVPTLVAVEAKASESFGSATVEQELRSGLAKRGSFMPERIAQLTAALPGHSLPNLRDGEELPEVLRVCGYQLLTATVATVVEAGRRHCQQAVLMVHEFRSAEPSARLKAAYAKSDLDLSRFVDYLGQGPIPANGVVGPILLQGSDFCPSGVRLFIGRCTTHMN